MSFLFFLVSLAFSAVTQKENLHRPGDKLLAGNIKIDSFRQAKQKLRNVYQDHQTTFYCACPYKKKKVDYSSCSYKPKKMKGRSLRTEWEHVVPAHAFGQSFAEWRQGHMKCMKRGRNFKGRKCARKANELFRRMEADLYNLVPAIGELNQLRSNFSMAEIAGERRQFGSCDVEIENRKIEPPKEVRGDIARIYFYMHGAYRGRGIVSRSREKLFASWSKADPVDQWECVRACRIEKIQGNENPFVKSQCQKLKFYNC